MITHHANFSAYFIYSGLNGATKRRICGLLMLAQIYSIHTLQNFTYTQNVMHNVRSPLKIKGGKSCGSESLIKMKLASEFGNENNAS